MALPYPLSQLTPDLIRRIDAVGRQLVSEGVIQPDTVTVTATVPLSVVVSLRQRWGLDTDDGVVTKALEDAYNASSS